MKSDPRIKIWKGDITDKATCSQLIDEVELRQGGREVFLGNVSRLATWYSWLGMVCSFARLLLVPITTSEFGCFLIEKTWPCLCLSSVAFGDRCDRATPFVGKHFSDWLLSHMFLVLGCKSSTLNMPSVYQDMGSLCLVDIFLPPN